MRSVLFALIVALQLLSGCATHFANQPLTNDPPANRPQHLIERPDAERPLILVAISGGGSRAAALGWVVLRELRRFRYRHGDEELRSLIDDIAVVSSVSGGSVIAAHFALNGPGALDDFEPAFLAPENTRSIVLQVLNPVTWVRQAINGESRSELVQELLDRQLFKNRTFAELNQPDKPYLILNATDMASGEVFAFTRARFDDICSDLDALPISAGVAASAAVPVLFTPVALVNHSAKHCAGRKVPDWITNRLDGGVAPYLNLDRFKQARYANDLRNGPDPFRRIDYLYLLDGGLADNLAIHGLLDVVSSPFSVPLFAPLKPGSGRPDSLVRAINTGRIKKIAVILVNARADPAREIYESDGRPGIVGMIGSVTSVPIDSASASVNAQMETLLADLNRASIKVYNIVVDFDQLRASDPAQRALRDQVKEIPTLWTISRPDLDAIERAGTTLLRQHPCFQLLLVDLAISEDFVDPESARKTCAQAADR